MSDHDGVREPATPAPDPTSQLREKAATVLELHKFTYTLGGDPVCDFCGSDFSFQHQADAVLAAVAERVEELRDEVRAGRGLANERVVEIFHDGKIAVLDALLSELSPEGSERT